MAAAAVMALFVPSAVAGDPGSGGRASRTVPEVVAEPDGRGGGVERPTVRWASIAGGAPAPVADAARPRADAPPFAARPGGEVLPVLPLGAGLACLGLGLGALGLRLRRL
jgi:hypothetical protein